MLDGAVSCNTKAGLVATRKAYQKESRHMKTADELSVLTLSRRAFLGTLAAGPFVLRHRVADAAVDPAVVGTWAPRVRLPNIAIHVSVMPGTTRTFMAFAKVGNGTLCWLYDWATKSIISCNVPFAYDFMCGGGVLDDDGALRVYGGRDPGANRSARFDPAAMQWTWGPYMSGKSAAYYPSAVRVGALPNYPRGAVVIGFGRRAYLDIYDPEDYGATIVQRMPASANIASLAGPSQNYPRLQPLPDGDLFLAGTEQAMLRLNITTAKWTPVASMKWGRRYDGCATPLAGDGYSFLLSGGDTAAVKKRMEIVNAQTGVIRETATLRVDRHQHNTTVLPDGTVLLIGGTNGAFAPEIFDPVTETAKLMAPTLPWNKAPGSTDKGQPYRAYHSTASLLDDGRVMWAGGIDGAKGQSLEVFSPPYLYKGPFDAQGNQIRPELNLAPGAEQFQYGGLATFTSVDAQSISRVTLVKAGHVSHGYDAEQKHIELQIVLALPDGTLQVAMPASSTVAPPGWYRVFALKAGVPSLAQWVRMVFA